METDFIHPANTASVATQPLTPAYVAAPAAPPIAVPRPMDASFAAPPARPIGFQPVQQARPAASTFTPPIASPTVLPVVETPVIANQFMAPVEAPSAAAPQRRRLLSMNRLAVAAAFTVFMLGTVGSVYLFIRGQEPGSPGSATRGVVVPEQDLGPEVRLSDVQGGGLPEAQTLIVNGDIRLQGALNFSNGDYLASVVQGNLTTDQAYTLPDVSGEFCLSANNCAYATTVQFAQVETELEALQVLVADPQQLAAGSGIIITGDTIQNSGVLTMNGQSGAVVLTGGSGIVVSGTTITNDGVTSLVGTVNQVNVSGGTGGITLSLPQNIAVTSSPTFAGLTVNGGGTFSGSLAASNLSGTNTGDIAVSGQNYLSLTGQSITVGQVNLGGTHVTGTLPVTQGGTGLNTFNMQGVLYGNGTGALGVTVAGTNGQCLVGNTGSAPTWTSCTAAADGAAPGGSAGGDLGGTYPNPTIAKLQGTNLLINSPLNGQILVYNTVNNRWDNISSSLVCPAGSGNLSGGGNSVNVGLGGTCGTLGTVASPQFSSLTLTTALSVTNGGTGMTGFTQYGLLFGNATGALGVTVAGTTNECLVGNASAAPSWIACNIISAGAEPGGSAGGDLGGTYPNPTLAKLQGTNLLVNIPAAGHVLVYNATNSRWDNVAISGDIAIGQTGVATIQANSVQLGTDTVGDYISSLGTLTGLSATVNTGEGSTPTLSVLYGSTPNTAAQGNTTLICASGSGNLSGGGNTITLGTGGTCTGIAITNAPVFSASVTSPIFQGSGAMTLNTLATGSADDIIIKTADVEVARILENGNVGIGTTNPTSLLHVIGTGSGGLFKVTDTTATTQDVLTIADGGATTLRNQTNTTVAFKIQNAAATVDLFTADTTNSKITLGGDLVASSVATAITGTTEATARTNVTVITLTTDAFSLNDVLFFNNAGQDYYARITVDNANGTYTVSPAVSYDASITVTKYNVQNIGATATDYTTQTNRFFQGYFLGGVVTGAGSTTLSDGNLQSTVAMNYISPSYNFKNSSDSTQAFTVQNAAGEEALVVDTTNKSISIGVASGQKQTEIIEGTTEGELTSSTIDTSTASTATAYSNQRKIDRTSTGRLWSAFNQGNNTQEFWYSDDNGATWTQNVSANITNVANGSLFIDVNDHAHFAYSDGTTVRYRRMASIGPSTSWGAEFTPNGSNTEQYPDVVAHPEGSGWKVHIVYSFINPFPIDRAQYSRLNIASDGTISSDGAVVLGNYGNTTHKWPSIDFNHTGDGKTVASGTPHLYVAWSAGATGAGLGIRFKKATYSGGSWTWGTEREIDSARYWTSGSASGVQSLFDGTRVIIGGSFNDGGYVSTGFYERDKADTTTSGPTWIRKNGVTEGNDLGSVAVGGFSYDADGNLHFIGMANNGAWQLNYRKWTRSSGAISANSYITSLTLSSWDADVSAKRGYSDNRIEFVYTDGAASPFSVKYGSMAISTIPGTTVYDTTSKLVVVGNVEADGFTINGVAVGTSTDSYWSASGGNIHYNGGNVGIGTITPQAKLAVSQVAGTSYQLNLDNTGGYTTGNYSGIQFTQGGTTQAGYIKLLHLSNGGSEMALGTRSDNVGAGNPMGEVIRLTNTGNVGIGTTGPSRKLEVIGDVSFGDVNSGGMTVVTGPSTTATARLRLYQSLSGGANIALNGTWGGWRQSNQPRYILYRQYAGVCKHWGRSRFRSLH